MKTTRRRMKLPSFSEQAFRHNRQQILSCIELSLYF